MKSKSFHKTFFAILLVLAPLWWLTMTDDGQRRVDAVLLLLLGDQGIDLKIAALDDQLTEAELQQVYPDLHWQCSDAATDLGDRMCSSKIGTYNGLPAHRIAFYFGNGHLNALKLNYRENYHAQLGSQLIAQLGEPNMPVAVSEQTPPPENILRWYSPHGMVIIKEVLKKGDEAAMLWLSQ